MLKDKRRRGEKSKERREDFAKKKMKGGKIYFASLT